MSWFAPIFDKLLKLSENVVVSKPPGKEQKIPEEHQISEERLFGTYLKHITLKLRQLIAHLKDYTEVTWNNNGEMVVNAKSVPDTNKYSPRQRYITQSPT